MADEHGALTLDDLHGETEIAHGLFRDGHWQEAVRKAAERYVNRIAERADHPDAQNRQGKNLIERVFSEDSPILTLNSHESLNEWTLTDRDEHNGYRFLGAGLMLAIRNVMTHTDEHDLTPTEALEWLAFISAMHRRLDSAQQVAPPQDADTPDTDSGDTGDS